MWCQNQNFGDPHGCLVGKDDQFGKISFLALKKNLQSFRARFENAMGNPFLTLSNMNQNALN